MFNENINSTVCELSEEQLKTVIGGLVVISQIAIRLGLLLTAGPNVSVQK